jgi:phosphoheptose isomerase
MKNDFMNYRKMLNDALDTVDQEQLDMMKREMVRLAKNNYPLFVCGNGGSAAIAEHLSCDHNKGVCTDTNLYPFIVSLGSNVSLITAIANDIGYEEIFSKQVQWFGNWRAGLLAISSSGNSPNIINALKAAKNSNMSIMSMVGFDGGAAKDLSDICVHVKSDNYGVVEDCHQILMHSIAQSIRMEYAVENAALKL